jgi:serine/threonine protein kinase
MNWVEGETLDEWVRHRPDRNPIDDLKVLVPVAAALDLMHSGRATGGVPVVHRDIKAANVLVTEHGSVLVDFGLTRGLPDGQRLTGVVGTPGYLAPESTEAGRYSAASDRYGFGGLAYFVLTGSEPPTSHKPDVMRASLATVPELAGCPEVSDQVMAMLAADPDERPSSLANWVGQLRRSSLEADPDVLRPPAPRRLPLEPREGKTPSADSPVPSPSAARGSSDRTRDSLSKFHRFRGRRGRPVAIALAVVVLVVGSTFLAQHLLNRTTVVYVLTPGTSLNNAVVSSQNGSYHLSLLSDGNLVVTDVATGDLLWQTCSFNVKQPNYLAAYTVMKQDGLYVQQQSGSQLGKITTLWNSNTLTGPALRFVLSDQGIPEVQSHGESLGGTSAGFSKVPPASCPSSS